MGSTKEIVLSQSGAVRWLSESLLKDVPKAKFACKPSGVDANHAAFIYGHIAIYLPDVVGMLGGEMPVPFANKELFDHGAVCKDDPECSIYPDMETISSAYFKAYDNAMAFVAECSDAKFSLENPTAGDFKKMAPTIGDVACFLLGSHAMFHLGQMSTWRRCMKLGPAM